MHIANSNSKPWQAHLLLLCSGALLPLAFAPLALWPLAILALLPLFALWQQASPRQAFAYGLAFGLGQFGVGVSWVYVAIHVYGQSPAIVAVLLTLLFVAVLALVPAGFGYLARALALRLSIRPSLHALLWLPAFWTLAEWFRGWFLTGFPWLNLGYSQIDSPLAGYAPLLGAYGLSLLVALSAALLLWFGWRSRPRRALLALPLLLLLWGGGQALQQLDWGQAAGEPLRVTLIQGNVPQITRWDGEMIWKGLDRYAQLSYEHMDSSDLIIWPENAVTMFYHRLADDYFDALAEAARASDTDIIMGVPLLDEDGVRYYTTMMSLGSQHAFYRKRHLVPFGEFMPLEDLLRGLTAFFDLPMSSFSRGERWQPLLQAAGQPIAASVCYEDAFGEELIDFLPEATLLVNGSNNAWYGNSMAPHQHLQISRMRALETARPMLRATTNGISAFIDPRGKVYARSEQFVIAALSDTVQPMQGITPYVRLGNYAVLGLLALMLLGALLPWSWPARQTRP
ncbi:MAG: apolipoprotein N-acyltransferase [Chromatiales bacterium]|nr:apolipoprotein N-acyltransferase [Chromatiales bacterium]